MFLKFQRMMFSLIVRIELIQFRFSYCNEVKKRKEFETTFVSDDDLARSEILKFQVE